MHAYLSSVRNKVFFSREHNILHQELDISDFKKEAMFSISHYFILFRFSTRDALDLFV